MIIVKRMYFSTALYARSVLIKIYIAMCNCLFHFDFFHVKRPPPINLLKTNISLDSLLTKLSGKDCTALDNAPAVIVNVPVSDIYTFTVSKIPLLDSSNPFVGAACALVDKDRNRAERILENYYNIDPPATAAQVLGINSESLRNIDSYCTEFPWEDASSDSARQRRKLMSVLERIQHGLPPDDILETSSFGPCSASKIKLEVDRIDKLIKSITDKGYQCDNLLNHCWGYALLDDSRTKVIIKGGQHRCVVLAALGFDKIPVLMHLNKTIRRAEIGKWPAVIAGQMSEREALKYFNSFFF